MVILSPCGIPHNSPPATLTYRELVNAIQTFASGLQALGVENRCHVALFADNSHRWFIADQGNYDRRGA